MLWYIFYRIWDRTSGIWGQGKIWTTTPPWWQAVSSVLIMVINLTDKKKMKFDSLYHQGQSCKYCYGVSLFCIFKPHFDVICDLLLNRPMAKWNLLVNPLTPKIWLLLLSSCCHMIPCKLVIRIWYKIKIKTFTW